MPWVRIDENAMDHPKFVAISANAWRLWCEGMTYCQKHLTDGFIPAQGAKGMRYYSTAAVGQLRAVLVPGKGPLWHDADGGFTVHDYHDWNESRDRVISKRQEAKDRMDRLRARSVPRSVGRSREQTSEQRSERTLSTPHHSTSHRRSAPAEPSEERAPVTREEQAGKFCEWYADTHLRLFAIGYMGTNRDYTTALTLCEKFTDAQLRDAAIAWFGADDDFAIQGTRTIAKFASRVSGYLQEIKARGIA
jgi:hypothetical protein